MHALHGRPLSPYRDGLCEILHEGEGFKLKGVEQADLGVL